MTSDRRPNGKGRNFTVNIRMSREEIEAARKLGDGNISMGFRHAIRYACWKEMKPIKLSVMLRGAAHMAEELENARSSDSLPELRKSNELCG